MSASAAEVRATAIVAIAKALVEVANDFGEGNQIAGDTLTLAEAAFAATAPYLAAAERERCAQLAEQHMAWCSGKSLRPGRAEPGRFFADLLREAQW